MPPRLPQKTLLRICQPCLQKIVSRAPTFRRFMTVDHRNRLSTFFTPTGGIASATDLQEDTHATLIRAGYIRQPYSGFFHYLPLGQRVHEKLEKLIDKHMRSVGASKLALSTISSERLWERSGRLGKAGPELFRLEDRKESKYLLSPTHEEEITTLISSMVKSHNLLPLRVYQISRKYRDEKRPRLGLMRGREFTMKDLYTFDATEVAAIETYKEVQAVYRALFDELGLPYIFAEADSGNIGGSLSHEYHYSSPSGEDTVISCTNCGYCANEEAAQARPPVPSNFGPRDITVFHGITADRKTLLNVFYPRHTTPDGNGTIMLNEVHASKVRGIVNDFDPSAGNALDIFYANFTEYNDESEAGSYSQIINLFDIRVPFQLTEASFSNHSDQQIDREFMADKRIPTTSIVSDPETGTRINFLRIKAGDGCPKCEEGKLKITAAIELGHTFHLGTRYSAPLRADVLHEDKEWRPMEMGCHGIGVSRMIPAIAEGYRDEKGLCWPRVIAPFEVVLVYGLVKRNSTVPSKEDIEAIYDVLTSRSLEGETEIDVMLDDRSRDLMWKMKDAVLVGYPIMCVMGRAWVNGRKVEIEVRRTGAKMEVELSELKGTVKGLLKEL